jgi:hypothetical protein
MAFENDVMDVSLLTATDLSAAQYHFVKLSADNKVVICSHATNDNPIGVLQNKPDGSSIEAVARVRIMGVSRVYVAAGGAAALAFGDKVGTDASGHGITKATDTYKFLGVTIEGAATTELAAVLLTGAIKTIKM